jgi:hypothetical protein
MQANSIKRAKYFLTSINDYSKMTFIYFLKWKNEMLQHFKEYKLMVERKTCKMLKVL